MSLETKLDKLLGEVAALTAKLNRVENLMIDVANHQLAGTGKYIVKWDNGPQSKVGQTGPGPFGGY